MLRDITIGQHFPGNSLVHRFDPRLKLVLTIVYIVMLFAALIVKNQQNFRKHAFATCRW